ncbi:MAG: lipid-A-disaccharide synthase N-terminal domain-containing protein, partial [Bacteroidales bacterium]|nr:lipid-A-disaccharide synthase N-terminal domain-containing protein [Bacteroidales bacterium]
MKWLYIIGFLAQALFSARLLLQWLLSERSRQVVSPSVYWILSIAGSYLLFIYGWLRDDFAIIFGQFISYYIYHDYYTHI